MTGFIMGDHGNSCYKSYVQDDTEHYTYHHQPSEGVFLSLNVVFYEISGFVTGG